MLDEQTLAAVLSVARRIVNNEVAPYEGATAIWSLLAGEEGDYPEDLRIFVGLASEYQDHPHHREAYDRDIREEAQALLARHRAGPGRQ